jgi:hypothetical protein
MRCSATLFWFPHDVVLEQKRDEAGRLCKPHTLLWRCVRCQRIVGETTLAPKWRMLSWLRRQAVGYAQERKSA